MSGASSALLACHGAGDPVAFGEGGLRTAGDLLRDTAAVAEALNSALPVESRMTGAQALLVFKSDRYAFAVGLLGAWAAGLPVALPPNLRAETISGLLSEPKSVALLHDTAVMGHYSVPELLGRAGVTPLVEAPSIERVAAFALTSGSTGTSEVWGKGQAQLEQEVVAWARTFGLGPGDRIVSTVPPAHLYGLLFTVLLPLVSGGAFCRETPLHPEAVAQRVSEHLASVLVTVPVHLRVARVIEPKSLVSLKRVFSSTAPLPASLAEQFQGRHGRSITEIFGSTETGGIAWRQRGESESWQPLEGVSVSVSPSSQLVVDSPYLSEGLSRPFTTADRVELQPDKTFVSLGRLDNVVKVGGYRVSLSAMEEWLLRQPELSDAVVVAGAESSRGARILVALVPVDPALELEPLLRERMVESFEPSTLPRRFIFLHRLPREPSGKLQRHRVLSLFGLDPQGLPLTRALRREAARVSEVNQVAVSVQVPRDYAYYGGHFETYPVMAGAVQLQELLAPLIEEQRPEWGPLGSVSRVKFTGRIAPGDAVEVRLTFNDEARECGFDVRQGERSVSAGKLNYQALATEA